jgi:sec-independent protein translocase protein TatA
MGLGAPELLIVLAVVLLIFGGKKLPELARSLGQAKNEFEDASTDKSARPVAVPVATRTADPVVVNGSPTTDA